MAGPGDEPSNNGGDDGHGVRFLLSEDDVSFGSGLRHQNAIRNGSVRSLSGELPGCLEAQKLRSSGNTWAARSRYVRSAAPDSSVSSGLISTSTPPERLARSAQ